MKFPRTIVSAALLDSRDSEAGAHSIEFRQDPLTGTRCRLNVRRTARLVRPQAVDLTTLAVAGPDCPFCPQNIDRATPRLPEHIAPVGRLARGESCLFSNLYPVSEYHAAVTISHAHFLDLDQFSARQIADAVTLVRQFVARVCASDGRARYPLFVWNHLPPSAASIVHPHMQVIIDRRPTPYQARLLQCSRNYQRRSGASFWADILAEEKRLGERYIGDVGSVAAFASFSPQGNREVQMVLPGAMSLLDLDEPRIDDLAECTRRILVAYKRMGMNSFNLTSFSAGAGRSPEYYTLHAKLISRPVLQPLYRNDSGALERLHYEMDVEATPESVAQAARELFPGAAS